MTPTEPRTDLRALVMQAISSFVEPNQRLDGTLDMDDPRGIHVDEPDDIPMFLDKIIGVFLDRLAAAESQAHRAQERDTQREALDDDERLDNAILTAAFAWPENPGFCAERVRDFRASLASPEEEQQEEDDPISDARQPEDGPPPGRWPR
jgi:hypothetical protein